MNKKDRETVFNKCGGRCAFCGETLLPGWHVWDIIGLSVAPDGGLLTGAEEMSNLLPVCKGCGGVRIKHDSTFAGKMDIEDFRREIMSMYLFMREGCMYASSLRRAIKFGIIKETNQPIVFYFEKLAQALKDKP